MHGAEATEAILDDINTINTDVPPPLQSFFILCVDDCVS